MLFSVSNLFSNWQVDPQGVLHVGAHEGEEWPQYETHSWLPVTWVEGQENLAKSLEKRLPKATNLVIQAYVWSQSNIEKTFNIASNGQSSSLLEFGSHSRDYPQITVNETLVIRTKRLDEIIPDDVKFDFINVDLQGVELEALKGLGKRILDAKWIYSEVNRKAVYKNCTLVDELDRYLKTHGFSRKATRWCLGKGWGDALYIHQSVPRKRFKFGSIKTQIGWYLIESLRITRIFVSRLIRLNAK